MIHYALLGFGIALSAVGQYLLKSGADTPSVVEQFLSPTTMTGLICYGIASICYSVSLRAIPLSVAYPSVSAGYVIVVVIAHLLWDEPLGLQQVAAVALITGGIGLLYWKA